MYAKRLQNGEEGSHDLANILMTLIICCKYLLQIIEFIFVYSTDNLWLFNILPAENQICFEWLFYQCIKQRRRADTTVVSMSVMAQSLTADCFHREEPKYSTWHIRYRDIHTTYSPLPPDTHAFKLPYPSAQVCMLKAPPFTGFLLEKDASMHAFVCVCGCVSASTSACLCVHTSVCLPVCDCCLVLLHKLDVWMWIREEKSGTILFLYVSYIWWNACSIDMLLLLF